MNIITCEKLQNIADIFIGYEEDFKFNPYIYQIKYKHILFDSINNLIYEDYIFNKNN